MPASAPIHPKDVYFISRFSHFLLWYLLFVNDDWVGRKNTADVSIYNIVIIDGDDLIVCIEGQVQC